jgi:DNA-binding transcriptional LysR family regulator
MRGTQFSELSAFVAVAEQASFTKAAKQIGLSTATLSQTIRALEERLGVRLLNRTTRSVSPTEAGGQLLARLRPALDGFDDALESMNAFRDRPAGHLRLTVPPPVASFVLAPLLASFLKKYPEIALEISVDGALVDIVANRLDAGIRFGPRVARDMIAVPVTDKLHVVVVAAPEYLARRPRPQTPKDLLTHNCIRLRFGISGHAPWHFLVNGKETEFDVEGSLTVNDGELAVRAALDGVGILYMLEDYVAPMIADGRLVALLDAWLPPPADGFYLYYPSRRQNPAALQALIEFLRANFKASGSAEKERRTARP